MPTKPPNKGEIAGRPLTAKQEYFYEMSYKDDVEPHHGTAVTQVRNDAETKPEFG